MSYILQRQLDTYDRLVEAYDDNERLVMALAALPDERLLSWLRGERAGRRNEYPQEVLWRCLVAKYVYQIRTYAELIRELERNGSLRRLVGIAHRGRVPQAYHFSRFVRRLSSEEGLEHLEGMFGELVGRLGGQLPQMGQYLAVDATAVHAYSNENRREKSDRDGAWSARPKRQRRGRGGEQSKEYTDYWFGYLAHLVVDCETELAVGYEVTAANVNETTRFIGQLEGLEAEQPEIAARAEAVIADAGYDSVANCAHVLESGALPIIKMRLTQSKDEICQAATCCCNELGTLICDSGHRMVYWGRDGDYLKWRCPVACGQAQECTAFGRCSSSKYGTVVKISIHEDPRRFPGLARESKRWKRLYRKRTAVERVNGRLKDFLLLDELTIRGMAKVRMHVGVALLLMVAGAWAQVEAGRAEQARRIVRLAA